MATTGFDLSQVQQSTTNAALAQTGNLNSYIEQLAGIQAANNAVSAQMAADQREWSAEQAELTRRFNSAEAAKNRDWQQLMSNTAHQREIKDLQAAGLNPVLSAMGGNGAAVTSGATASASNPNGASSQADTSLSGAIVSLLSTSLKTMSDIASMSTSALTNQSVADKYTAAQMAAAEMSSSASRYGADRSVESAMIHAAATELAASLSSEATRYAAGLSNAASIYASDVHKYIADTYQSNPWQFLSGLFNGNGGKGLVSSSIPKISSGVGSILNWVKDFLGLNDDKGSPGGHKGAGSDF